MHIAILEDDRHQSEAMAVWMQAAGHEVTAFFDGASFKSAFPEADFDLLVLDWVLPDTEGIEIMEWIRKEQQSTTPVIFITQRDSEEDIVLALQKGADDYMIKPVKPLEMLARLTAIGRRIKSAQESESDLRFGEFVVIPSSRVIEKNGEKLDLTHKEFDLSLFLLKNIGRLLSRSAILENVWGTKPDLNTRTVDTHISRIRNKLDLNPNNGWKLSAIYQHGYRLERLEPQAKGAS